MKLATLALALLSLSAFARQGDLPVRAALKPTKISVGTLNDQGHFVGNGLNLHTGFFSKTERKLMKACVTAEGAITIGTAEIERQIVRSLKAAPVTEKTLLVTGISCSEEVSLELFRRDY